MIELIESLDSQIQEALQIGRRFSCPKPEGISQVFFCGVGGSGICGDLLRVLSLRSGRVPFEIFRSGLMPGNFRPSTFVILSSYSGHSREVLEVLKKASQAGSKILAVSAGGELAQRAALQKNPMIRIPGGMAPRCAIGHLTFSLFPILKQWGWLKYSESDLKDLLTQIKDKGRLRRQGRELAEKMKGKCVRFYGVAGQGEPVTARWRAQLAENAKTLATNFLIPEMFHNEMEGWKFPKGHIQKTLAVFFREPEVPEWIQKKIQGAQRHIRSRGAQVINVEGPGKSFLARTFYLMHLADWASYELALLLKEDPAGIPVIESLKRV